MIKKIKLLLQKLFKSNACLYYLSGSETLPKAYTVEEENEKLQLLSDGNIDAKNDLIEHNLIRNTSKIFRNLK